MHLLNHEPHTIPGEWLTTRLDSASDIAQAAPHAAAAAARAAIAFSSPSAPLALTTARPTPTGATPNGATPMATLDASGWSIGSGDGSVAGSFLRGGPSGGGGGGDNGGIGNGGGSGSGENGGGFGGGMALAAALPGLAPSPWAAMTEQLACVAFAQKHVELAAAQLAEQAHKNPFKTGGEGVLVGRKNKHMGMGEGGQA